MERPELALLLDRIAEDGAVSPAEALEIRRAVFPDGVVDRAEAEALVRLAARTSPPVGAEPFAAALAEALCDHVLGADGHVSDADAEWLAARAQTLPKALAAEVLVYALRRAESAPASLAAEARASMLAACAGRTLNARDVDQVRVLLFAAAGEGAVHVGLEEARWILALDAACEDAPHDPSWPDLFMKAMLNHVMGQRASPLLARAGMQDRRAWLAKPEAGGALSFLARAFAGGGDGYFKQLRTSDMRTEMERHYQARVEEGETDAKLTFQEVAHLVALVRADGRRTANETRLIEEVRRLEAAA